MMMTISRLAVKEHINQYQPIVRRRNLLDRWYPYLRDTSAHLV